MSIIIIALRIVYRVTIRKTLGLAVNEVPRSLCIYTVTLFWLFRFSFGYLHTLFFSSTFKASSIASSNSLLSDLCFRYSFLEVTGILVTVFVLT